MFENIFFGNRWKLHEMKLIEMFSCHKSFVHFVDYFLHIYAFHYFLFSQRKENFPAPSNQPAYRRVSFQK